MPRASFDCLRAPVRAVGVRDPPTGAEDALADANSRRSGEVSR